MEIVREIISPLIITSIVFVLAALLALIKPMRSTALVLAILGIVLSLVFGFGLLNSHIARAESEYAPFPADDAVKCSAAKGAAIVVLGCASGKSDLPVRFATSQAFSERMREGSLLLRRIPGSVMLVSVGRHPSKKDVKAFSDTCSATYGIPADRFQAFADVVGVSNEAKVVKALAGKRKIVLVTSAIEMAGAVAEFKKAGLDATPAPCDFTVGAAGMQWSKGKLPYSLDNWAAADRCVRSLLGGK